ncbi:MAG: thiamine pyrophosphate-dependent dehydrogenase E1 component subunit alpha [Pseudomonadota bacterium]
MSLTNSVQREMYRNMVTSRYYEEQILAAYLEGKQPVFNMAKGPVPGEMHLSNGQEPCAAAVCIHLRDEDFVSAGHRPHHVAIAKGVDLDAMTAEIFGKATGLSRGKGGHMHIFDPKVNFSCSGIIAQGMGPAAGAALAMKMQNRDDVAVAFIGEGAANQGAFHEVLNLAAIWTLPFICVIEDNAWGVSVAKSEATAVTTNDVRASAYGIPGHRVERNDINTIYDVAGKAIARARAGEGPSLIEIETYRLQGHFVGDSQDYRTKDEMSDIEGDDPIPRMRSALINGEGFSDVDLDDLEAEARDRVDNAIAFARESAYPAPEEALENVFV